MGPTAAVTTCLRKYADFDGRASKGEYWGFLVPAALLAVVVDAVPGNLGATLGAVVALALLAPLLGAASRRLHDTGRSGWWQLILLVPVLGLVALVLWLLQDGEPHVNAYGVPPT